MSADPFTPFVEAARQEALAELGAALGEALPLGPGRLIGAEQPRPTQLRARWEPPEGPALELIFAEAEQGAWRLGPWSLQLARDPGLLRHPTSRALLERLAQALGPAPRPAPQRLLQARRRWSALSGVTDRDYRHLELAGQQPTGLLRLGFRCNQDCHFCWEARDWADPPPGLARRWLEELRLAGAQRLTICGGEPTLYRELPELIARARALGLPVHLHSNAIALRRPETTARLREAGLQSLLISLHAGEAALSDAMTRAPGTFARSLEGAEEALRQGLTVLINCAVERQNAPHLEAHAALIVERLVRPFPHNPVRVVNYSQPGLYSDPEAFARGLCPLDELRAPLARAARRLAAAGVGLELVGSCGFPHCALSLAPELLPPRRPASSLDPHHQSGRRLGPGCQACARREDCVGPRREYLDLHGERGLEPFLEEPDPQGKA